MQYGKGCVMASKASSRRAWLTGIGAILMSCFCLIPFSLFSMYIEPMTGELGASVGQLTLIPSLWTAGCFVSSLIVGTVMKKVNQRLLIVIGAATIFLFQFSIFFADGVIPIYICAFLNGFGSLWCGMAMAQISITMWFAKYQGIMMSACIVMNSVIITILFPVVGNVISATGYRELVLILGIICGIGGALTALLVSPAPQKFGLAPYGATLEEQKEAASGDEAVIPSLSWGKIVKSPVFWCIIAVVFLGGFSAQAFNAQGAVVLGSFGLDVGQSALALSIFTLVVIFTQLLFGLMCDKASPRMALFVFAGINAVVLLLSFMLVGWIGAIVFVIGMAFGAPISGLYGANAAPRIFGPAAAGNLIGFVNAGAAIGSTLGPICMGLMYDAMGSYSVALEILGVLLIVAMLFNAWLYSKGNRKKIQDEIAAENA